MRANPYKQPHPYVVVIPFWIQESLHRNNLTIEECLDYEKIKRVVSTDDLAGFYNAQTLLRVLVGSEDNMLTSNELYGLWERNIPLDRPELRAEMQDFTSNLARVLGPVEQLIGRLFDDGTKEMRYPDPFKIVDLANKVFGLVIYPGHFDRGGELCLQGELVKALLKAFNMYDAYDELAASPLFKRFLDLLSGGYTS